jgi:tRNA guanosine-2'-O-methyltransferase
MNEEEIFSRLCKEHAEPQDVENIVNQILQLPEEAPNTFWFKNTDVDVEKNEDRTLLYRAWLQWLLPGQKIQLPLQLLHRNLYWLLIQRGLYSSSSERRKLCLAILKHSLRLSLGSFQTPVLSFSEEGRELAVQSVDRYCSIFETVVFGRYTNQTEECVKLLPKSCLEGHESGSDSSELHQSWWIIFLAAALTLKNAPHVSRIIGDWIMAQRFMHIRISEELVKFITDPFLNWASQGSLFTASTRREGYFVHCEHGFRLSSFIAEMKNNSIDCHDRAMFVEGILRTLREKKLNPPVIGFILQGLVGSSQEQDGPLLQAEDINDISPYSKSEAHGVLADDSLSVHFFYRIQLNSSMKSICNHYLRLLLRERASSSYIKYVLSNKAELPTRHTSGTLNKNEDISAFLQSLEQPFHRALFRDNLSETCESLVQLVTEQEQVLLESSSQQAELLVIFEIIWKAAERVRHPTSVMKLIPLLFYQSSTIRIARKNERFQKFLSSCLVKLWNLSQTKIQVWTPLARAIRKAYRRSPDLSQMLPLGALIEGFARDPPAPTVQHLLDCAVFQGIRPEGNSKTLIQLADETYGHAHMFDLMNKFRATDCELGKSIIFSLLMPWSVEQQTAVPAASPKISVLQTILILAGRCMENKEDVTRFRAVLMTALGLGVNPIARYLFQWMFVASIWDHPEDLGSEEAECLTRLESSMNENVFPTLTVSLLRIALCLASHPKVSLKFIEQFMSLLPTFCCADKVAIRHEAQWTVPKLMDIAKERHVPVSETHPYFFLDHYIRSLKNFKSPPPVWRMEQFMPHRDQNLEMLFEGPYRHLDNYIWNGPTTEEFESVLQEDAMDLVEDSIVPDLPGPYLQPRGSTTLPKEAVQAVKKLAFETTNQSLPIQSKSALSFDLLTLNSPNKINSPKYNPILVASHIDAPINLGGLSRVAEIHGCSELHLASLSVVSTAGFKSTSVTSESHITLIETPPSTLLSYLQAKKADGWTILGVEQTDSSLILSDPSTKLPKKAVVVMGAESTGIPAEVLATCDVCVEMKQWGITRSLNVQTAAGIVLYEWRRQWGDGR